MTSTYDWKADVEEAKPDTQESSQVEETTETGTEGGRQLQVTAPKKLSDRPMVLIAIVFGGLTGIILLIMMGYFTVTTIGAAISAEKHKNSDPATESFTAKTPFNQDQAVTKEQRLQQQLTSKDTDASITRFNDSAKNSKGTGKEKPGSDKNKTAEAQPTPAPPPENRVKVPKVVYRDRVVKEPAPPPKVVYRDRVVTKTVPAQQSQSNPRSQSARSSILEANQNPYEQWNQLASLGMVGGGDINSSQPQLQEVIYPDTSGIYPGTNDAYSNPSNDVSPVFDPSAFPDAASEPETETFTPSIDLALGSVVKGKLMHDVSFVDGATSTDKAVVELTEPLGEIPEGAMISTQIDNVDDNGALAMSVLGYEYENVYQEISLPQIQVTSAKASSGGNNFGRILADVAGIGLDVLNNETGQDIQFNDGRVSSISTNTNSGLLDRSVDAVSSRLLERNRSRSSTSKRSPKVKEGSTVKFTVIEPLT